MNISEFTVSRVPDQELIFSQTSADHSWCNMQTWQCRRFQHCSQLGTDPVGSQTVPCNEKQTLLKLPRVTVGVPHFHYLHSYLVWENELEIYLRMFLWSKDLQLHTIQSRTDASAGGVHEYIKLFERIESIDWSGKWVVTAVDLSASCRNEDTPHSRAEYGKKIEVKQDYRKKKTSSARHSGPVSN